MPWEMATPYFSTKSNLTYRGRELLIQTNLCSDQVFIFFCAFIWHKFPFFSLLLAKVRLWELFLFSHNFPKALRTWFSPCVAASLSPPQLDGKGSKSLSAFGSTALTPGFGDACKWQWDAQRKEEESPTASTAPPHRSATRQGTTSKHSCRSISLEMGQNLCILTTFYTRAH